MFLCFQHNLLRWLRLFHLSKEDITFWDGFDSQSFIILNVLKCLLWVERVEMKCPFKNEICNKLIPGISIGTWLDRIPWSMFSKAAPELSPLLMRYDSMFVLLYKKFWSSYKGSENKMKTNIHKMYTFCVISHDLV